MEDTSVKAVLQQAPHDHIPKESANSVNQFEGAHLAADAFSSKALPAIGLAR